MGDKEGSRYVPFKTALLEFWQKGQGDKLKSSQDMHLNWHVMDLNESCTTQPDMLIYMKLECIQCYS